LDVSELSCSVCFNSSVLLSAYNINVLHSKAAKIARPDEYLIIRSAAAAGYCV
jgi:hypothetical protein